MVLPRDRGLWVNSEMRGLGKDEGVAKGAENKGVLLGVDRDGWWVQDGC